MGAGFVCNGKNPLCCNQKNDIITLDLNLNISLNSKNLNINSKQNSKSNGEKINAGNNTNLSSNGNMINNNNTNNNINLNMDSSNKEFLAEIISQNIKNNTNSNPNHKANFNYIIKNRESNRNSVGFFNNNNININNKNNHNNDTSENLCISNLNKNDSININNTEINSNNTNNINNNDNQHINENNKNNNMNLSNIKLNTKPHTFQEKRDHLNAGIDKNYTKKNSFFFDKGNFINMKKRNLFEEYEIVGKLGEGAFGCVYKLYQKKTGFTRAVKVIKRQNCDNDYLLNEIIVLKSIDHPNVIKTFECYFDSNHYYMIQEYCSGGDLYDYIKKQKFFTEKKAACIMYQLLSAINHLHSKKIVHRDLKPENIVFINLFDSNKTYSVPPPALSSKDCSIGKNYIEAASNMEDKDKEKDKAPAAPLKNPLLQKLKTHINHEDEEEPFNKNTKENNSNNNDTNAKNNSNANNFKNINNKNINNSKNQDEIFIKLIDFGTSIFINNQPLTQELGTIYYIAPEVFRNNYNEKCDLWSCGVILYTMLCGHPPFRGKKEEEIKTKILKGEGNISSVFEGNEWKKVSKSAIDFVCELLEYNTEKRLSAQLALDNEWLNSLIKADDKDVNRLDEDIIKNLIKFHSSFTLQKASLAFIAIQTGESEDVSRIKKEFDKIDINKDGVITKNELVDCISNFHPQQEALKKVETVFSEVDFNNDGTINFSEFITVTIKKEKLLTEDNLKKAFKMFDRDENGYITIEELKEIISLDVNTMEEWESIVKEVDSDGDGAISYEEFKKMILKTIKV